MYIHTGHSIFYIVKQLLAYIVHCSLVLLWFGVINAEADSRTILCFTCFTIILISLLFMQNGR